MQCAYFGRSLALVIVGVVMGTACLNSRGEDSGDDWNPPPRAAAKKNPVAPDSRSIALGQKVYAHQCLCCHGARGEGDGPQAKDLDPSPHDLTSDAVSSESDGSLFWKITEGKKPMPSFRKQISELERWDVVNYLRTLAPRHPTSQP